MSMISRKANQMSLRTGIPICNHGMVPVYHPRGGGRNQSIFFGRQPQAPIMQPRMDGWFRAGMITNLVFQCIDYGMNWIGQILGWFGIGGGGGVQAPEQEKEAPKDEGLELLQATFNDPNKYVVKKVGDEYIVVDKDKQKTYKSKDFNEVLKQAGFNADGKKTTDNDDDKKVKAAKDPAINDTEGDPVRYNIQEITTPIKKYTVSAGNTWRGIVDLKYDIPKGVSAHDVSIALSAMNPPKDSGLVPGSPEAIASAHNGHLFRIGDGVNLPSVLMVNGIEVHLKDDAARSGQATDYSKNADGSRNDRYFAKDSSRFSGFIASVTVNGNTKYKVVDSDGKQVTGTDLYDTRELAEKAKTQKEKEANKMDTA